MHLVFMLRRRAYLRLPASVMTLALSVVSAASAGTIYFADLFLPDFESGSIRRVSTNGSGLTTLLDIGGGLLSVDVDVAGGKLYWSDWHGPAIRRSNLNGSNVEDIVASGLAFPSAIFIEPVSGKIYWGDQTNEEIGSANLDGSNALPIRTTVFHRGIGVDQAAGKIYWSTSVTQSTGRIVRSSLDGFDLETVIDVSGGFFKPASIALDVSNGKIYWTDLVSATVRRANLDGTEMETLYADPFGLSPRGLALDFTEFKIYWGQDTAFEGVGGAIYRSNFDGSGLEVVIDGLGFVNDLVVVPGDVQPPCDGDVNGDNMVDLADLATLLSNFGLSDATREQGDLDGSGTIDLTDIAILLTNFGAQC